MNTRTTLAVALVTALAATAGPAFADNPGRGKGNGRGNAGPPVIVIDPVDAVGAAVGAAVGTAIVDEFFTTDERQIITDYFRTHRYVPAGLPPGIAKNLARGKPLPPGIAKRYLPGDLIGLLPPRPGYDRIIVDDDVFLVSLATGIIVDVLIDVLAS